MISSRPAEEFGAVSPAAIDGVRQRDLVRIAGVPGVLGLTNFFCRSGFGEWRKRRTLFLVHDSLLGRRAARRRLASC